MKLSKEFQTTAEAAAEWAADVHAQVAREIAEASAANDAETYGGFDHVVEEQDYEDEDLSIQTEEVIEFVEVTTGRHTAPIPF